MDIIFNGTSCPIKYLHIGVQGNNLVDKIVFCVPRKASDGLDLSEFTPYIKIQNVKENYIDKDGKLTFDTTPTANSSNPVTSGGVKTALDAKAAKSEIVKTSTGLTDSADLMRYTDTLTISGGGVS